KMVAKRTDERYQTMGEVIADLDACGTRRDESASTHQPFGSSTDEGITNFLKELSAGAPKTIPPRHSPLPLFQNNRKQLLLLGGGVLGALILLAGLVFSLRTKEGTLVVTVNEPEAEVKVFNDAGTLEFGRKIEKGWISISLVPGKHGLQVSRDGFEQFTQAFE